MENIKISACIVIKDEEKYIGRCLDSIAGVVDEIVLVHDGPCKDKSLEIAKRHGARVFVRDWTGLPAVHRPFTFQEAKGEWIFHIDADEYLGEDMKKNLRKLAESNEGDAYGFNFPFFEEGKEITSGPYVKNLRPCLLRKSKLHYLSLLDFGPATHGKLVERWDLTLFHERESTRTTWDYCRTRLREVWQLQTKELLKWPSVAHFNLDLNDRSNPYVDRAHRFLKTPVRYTTWELFYDFYHRVRNGLLWSNFFSVKLFAIHALLKVMMVITYLKEKDGKRPGSGAKTASPQQANAV